MTEDLPGFDNEVVGFGMGIFFIGYLILEIPGTLLVEKWSARKWISRIMVSWGIVAALTAFVKTPFQFYAVRFLLGLAEAGFFPGVIVYLTHWFPARDRGRALSWFFIATPVAQFVSPKLSYFLLRIGTTETIGGVTVHYPALWGMQGWQWMYIAWGIPAVILGFLVFFKLPDWPKDARWLEPDERDALEQELKREKEQHKQGHAPHVGLPGAPAPQGAAAGRGLFLRRVHAATASSSSCPDPGEVVRPELEQSDLGGDHPAAGGAGRAAPGRLELGPHRRAPAARLDADLHGRRRARRCRC